MYVTAGVMTNAIGKVAVMIRGTPLVRQPTWVSEPWPPVAWSLMLSSSLAWNSGVSGACWASPEGLVWSHWVATPRGRFHCPPQSGYLDSSKAAAPVVAHNAASTAAAIAFRWNMTLSLIQPARTALCEKAETLRAGNRPASFGGMRVHRLRPETEACGAAHTGAVD